MRGMLQAGSLSESMRDKAAAAHGRNLCKMQPNSIAGSMHDKPAAGADLPAAGSDSSPRQTLRVDYILRRSAKLPLAYCARNCGKASSSVRAAARGLGMAAVPRASCSRFTDGNSSTSTPLM